MSAISTTMKHRDAASTTTRVYHVSPWRQALGWMFAPAAIGLGLGAMFADSPDERAGLWAGAAALALVTLGIVWMIRRARLEVGREGVVLRQIGFRLESTWQNVAAIRTERMREGFVTKAPVRGKGMKTLAAAACVAPYGMYDGSQQSLLDQHRFIPIEAFAWHLRKGLLAREIRTWAPHLAGDLATLGHKPQPTKERRRANWIAFAIIVAALAWGIVLVALGERVQAIFFNAAYALLDPLLVVTSAAATWQMWKRRSWLFTILMAMMTLVMIGWTIVHWGRLLG